MGKSRPGPVTRIRSAGVPAVAALSITATSARTTEPQARVSRDHHGQGTAESGSAE